MANAAFDTLAAIGADGAAVPYLAESIEPVDGDLTLWRMRLRPGIVFHDGTPLDAAAVKTNFDTQFASPLVSMAIRPFFPTDGAITVVDDLTVDYQGARTEFDVPQSIDRPARHDGLAGMVGRCGRGRDPESGAGRDGTVCHRLA